MKTVARLLVVVILLSYVSANSWKNEVLPDNVKNDIEWLRRIDSKRASNIENIIKMKNNVIRIKDKEIEEERSKKTFHKFLCAINIIISYTEHIWGKENKTQHGVYYGNLKNDPQEYNIYYDTMKEHSSCKIYEFLKSEEERKFPEERKNFKAHFVRPFAKWYGYLHHRKTLKSRNITIEIVHSPLYKDKIYKRCGIEDFIVDFIFSLIKLNHLVNFINHESIPKFILQCNEAANSTNEKDLMELLEEAMHLIGFKKWYFPLKYLIHINIVLKSYNKEPLEYVYAADGINIIPQSDKCPRYNNSVRGTTPHFSTTINTVKTLSTGA